MTASEPECVIWSSIELYVWLCSRTLQIDFVVLFQISINSPVPVPGLVVMAEIGCIYVG